MSTTRKPKPKPGGVWKFIPEREFTEQEKAEQEERAMVEVAGMLLIHRDRDNPFAAVEEFFNYFPGANKVEEGGAWIMVKQPPHCEYTVPPFSFWYAELWPMEHERHCSHRVKILTPKGELGLFPREYSKVEDISKYHEFFGEGIEIKFFGSEEGIPRDKLFYLRSRGISKANAIGMLIGQIRSHGVCWLEADKQYAEYFGYEWPKQERLATV